MICADCKNHKKCTDEGKLLLDADNFDELYYRESVEQICGNFIKRGQNENL